MEQNTSIWKSNWGSYIDLSKIAQISDLEEEALTYQGKLRFSIYYQQLENPIIVDHFYVSYRYKKNGKSEYDENGKMIKHADWWELKNWYDSLINAWINYKSIKNG